MVGLILSMAPCPILIYNSSVRPQHPLQSSGVMAVLADRLGLGSLRLRNLSKRLVKVEKPL